MKREKLLQQAQQGIKVPLTCIKFRFISFFLNIYNNFSNMKADLKSKAKVKAKKVVSKVKSKAVEKGRIEQKLKAKEKQYQKPKENIVLTTEKKPKVDDLVRFSKSHIPKKSPYRCMEHVYRRKHSDSQMFMLFENDDLYDGFPSRTCIERTRRR